MLSLAPVVALVFAASAFAQSTLTINTPINPPVCQPLRLSWSGGTPPYFLRVLPGNDPTGNTILDFGEQTGTGLTWNVNVTVGTSLGLTLTDSTGVVAQSAAFTVQSSTDQSCLNAKPTTGGSSASGSSAGTTVATTPVSTPAATTPLSTPANSATAPAASSKASSAAGSSAATGASASASAKASSAATAQKVSFGIAGALGAAALALLA